MTVQKIHHVAYRCMNAKATADFYERVLGLRLVGAVSDDRVPSTKEPYTYMCVLLDAGNGNTLAFFEVPECAPMGSSKDDPSWIQHIAFQVQDMDELTAVQSRAEAEGLKVVGPIDHSIFRSIYFFDPDGLRLEVAVPAEHNVHAAVLQESARAALEEWSQTKQPPPSMAWLHAREFKTNKESSV